MHAETPKQCECGALDELVLAAAPLRDFGPGVRRAVEQIETHRVADAPVVEVLAPTVHLSRRDLRRIVDHRGHHARLVHPGTPEGGGEFMVSSKALTQRLHILICNAQCLVRGKSIARHPV